MKRLIHALLFLLPAFLFAQQGRKNFLYAGGGYMSSSYFKESVFNTLKSATSNDNHNCLVLNAGYQFLISKDWRLGPSFSYDHFGLHDRSVQYSILSYSLRSDRIWKETKRTICYSGLSAGISVLKYFENKILKKHKANPCYQIYLFGTEIKADDFSLDLSVGYGNSGLLGFGVKYRF